ncbi:hypothetical protein [Nocardiopsis sp. L17-MgMaSL7]|uniref:hypothetical protein n=1 Tax=Nocardiopsis sp. L17-MgMaSL7 TaxID=1938893 RepID=UPI000D71D328|nr:hypothetical protein [Nocardiopsis sp. L17-MgMaSL7]PWV55084.1 hypothetical protein BDW27_10386 [Nocardiopsis sp. L17-MgMaSL7]
MELFEEGAKVLTQEMVKGGWTVVQGWITRVFKGDEAKRRRALDEVAETRRELDAGGGETVSAEEVEQTWRTQLRRLLREDPAAAAELRELLDEVAPSAAGGVTNIARDVHGGVLIQAGTIHGGVHRDETRYDGDHVDMSGNRAGRDVIGTQNNHGDRRGESRGHGDA